MNYSQLLRKLSMEEEEEEEVELLVQEGVGLLVQEEGVELQEAEVEVTKLPVITERLLTRQKLLRSLNPHQLL